MAFKFVIFACALAVANAGGLIQAPGLAYSAAPAVSHVSYASPLVSYGAPSVAVHSPSLTSQDSNIVRSYGNLGQIATQSKTITTPYSQVTKSDVRVSNPGYQTLAAAPALAYAHGPAQLAYAHGPAQLAYAHGPAQLSYAAPAAVRALAPAPLAYAAHGPAPLAYAAHGSAPLAYAAAAPAVKSVGLLGVAYSAAPAVSHMTYSAPAIGLSYGW